MSFDWSHGRLEPLARLSPTNRGYLGACPPGSVAADAGAPGSNEPPDAGRPGAPLLADSGVAPADGGHPAEEDGGDALADSGAITGDDGGPVFDSAVTASDDAGAPDTGVPDAADAGPPSLDWNFATAGPVNSTAGIVLNAYPDSSPNDAIYFGAQSGSPNFYMLTNVYATSPTVGWQATTGGLDGSAVAITADGSRVLVVDLTGKLFCFAATTGGVCSGWAAQSVSYAHAVSWSSPWIDYAGNNLYYADLTGLLYKVDVATGALVWSSAITTAAIHSSPLFTGGNVYVGDDSGYFYRVQDPGTTAPTAANIAKVQDCSGGGCTALAAATASPTADIGSGLLYFAGNGSLFEFSLGGGTWAPTATVSFNMSSGTNWSSPVVDGAGTLYAGFYNSVFRAAYPLRQRAHRLAPLWAWGRFDGSPLEPHRLQRRRLHRRPGGDGRALLVPHPRECPGARLDHRRLRFHRRFDAGGRLRERQHRLRLHDRRRDGRARADHAARRVGMRVAGLVRRGGVRHGERLRAGHGVRPGHGPPLHRVALRRRRPGAHVLVERHRSDAGGHGGGGGFRGPRVEHRRHALAGRAPGRRLLTGELANSRTALAPEERTSMRSKTLAALPIALALLGAAPAQAQTTPQTFMVQGVLRNSTGQLLSQVLTVTLNFWTAQTGGTNVKSYAGLTAGAENGVFAIAINDPALTGSSGILASNGALWTEVVITNPTFGAFPRQQVAAQLYAMQSSQSEGLTASARVPGSQITGAVAQATQATQATTAAQIQNIPVSVSAPTSGEVLVYNGASGTWVPSLVPTGALTGVLPIGNGGTGSATQNFVDLTTNQSIGGVKTFTSPMLLNSTSATTYGLDVTMPSQTVGSGIAAILANGMNGTGANGFGAPGVGGYGGSSVSQPSGQGLFGVGGNVTGSGTAVPGAGVAGQGGISDNGSGGTGVSAAGGAGNPTSGAGGIGLQAQGGLGSINGWAGYFTGGVAVASVGAPQIDLENEYEYALTVTGGPPTNNGVDNGDITLAGASISGGSSSSSLAAADGLDAFGGTNSGAGAAGIAIYPSAGRPRRPPAPSRRPTPSTPKAATARAPRGQAAEASTRWRGTETTSVGRPSSKGRWTSKETPTAPGPRSSICPTAA